MDKHFQVFFIDKHYNLITLYLYNFEIYTKFDIHPFTESKK